MIKHRTKKIRVKNKFADVDVCIVPVVKWLNKFKGIETLFSCHSDEYKYHQFSDKGHVLFCYKNKRDRKNIIKTLNDFIFQKLHIEYHIPISIVDHKEKEAMRWLVYPSDKDSYPVKYEVHVIYPIRCKGDPVFVNTIRFGNRKIVKQFSKYLKDNRLV